CSLSCVRARVKAWAPDLERRAGRMPGGCGPGQITRPARRWLILCWWFLDSTSPCLTVQRNKQTKVLVFRKYFYNICFFFGRNVVRQDCACAERQGRWRSAADSPCGIFFWTL